MAVKIQESFDHHYLQPPSILRHAQKHGGDISWREMLVASLIPFMAEIWTVVGGSIDGFLGALSAALLGLILWTSLVK